MELATGLHYQSSTGEWLDSKAEIEILTAGGATAGHGQHKSIFPPNLHGGVIELTTPEGKSLRSQILGLAYFDTASGTNVLLAELKDTQGEVHQPNVVIYPDAFTDIKADVRYNYTIDGFEQDIILHEHPADQKEYGLDPTTTRLQVLTEFFNPPQPVKEESELNIAGKNFIDDETLNFGVMQIGRGKAFFLDEPKAAIPVAKQWVNLDGRDFLIEEVPVADVQEELRPLPAAEGASLNSRRARRTASVKRNLPALKLTKVAQTVFQGFLSK